MYNQKLIVAVAVIAFAGMLDACSDDSSRSKNTPGSDCPSPEMVSCDGTCIDPLTDNKFCGATAKCENFTFCTDGKTCENGVCVGGTVNECEPGMVKCGADCIDPLTDNNFCGATAKCEGFAACFDGSVCVGGTCSVKTEGNCPEGQVKCGGACIDPQTNMLFCGADASCASYRNCAAEGKRCEFGECAGNGCELGKSKCGDDCIDPLTDNNYCGADDLCESFATCVDGQICMGGVCSINTEGNCPDGMVKCGESCIDPQTNKSFCGADETCASYSNCAADGKTCEDGLCVGGASEIECEPGKVKCGTECIDPLVNGRYCGADEQCGGYTACKANQRCEFGSCNDVLHTGECDPGLVMCGGECINPEIDDQYCGANADCSDYKTCAGSYKCEKFACIDTMPLELIMNPQAMEVVENDNIEISLSLNRAPDNDINVVLSLDPGSTDYIRLSNDKISFSPNDWQDHKFHILTDQDYKKTGDIKLKVRAAADKLSTEQDILFKDIDECGLNYTVDNPATSENGTTASVSVSLTCIPDSNVIYTISSDNPNEGIVQTPADQKLVFVPDKWNELQTITVAGADDSAIDGDQNYHVVLMPDAANPNDFRAVYAIDFVNHDNDVPGINAKGITIKEGGAGEVNVSVSTKPSSNVVIKPDALPNGLELVDATELQFSPDNYMTPQTLVIRAVDNDIVDGNRNYNVHLTAASADSDYNQFGTDIQVAVEDNDKAGLVISEGASLDKTNVSEGGLVRSCFALTSKPTQNVTINIELNNAVEGSKARKTQYTFTPDNWNKCQWLEIDIGRDGIVNSSAVQSTVTFKGSSSDTNYTGTLKSGTVSISNIDEYKMTIRGDYVTTISEDDSSYYDICMKLEAIPSSTVSVKPTASNKEELHISSSISFKSTDWNQWKCLRYTSIDDDLLDGDKRVYITFALSSSDTGFNGLSYKSKVITVVDNEKPAFIVGSSSNTELDCTDSSKNYVDYDVSLGTKPTGNVTVSVSLAEYKSFDVEYTKHAGISVSPTSVKFTPSEYGSHKMIRVSCTTSGMALYNYLKTNIVFHSVYNNYPAADVTKTFTTYPIGKELVWAYTSDSATGPIYIPRGEYKVSVNGARGGGGHAGYGGQVIANILIGTTIKPQTQMYVYAGEAGDYPPQSANALNYSGGWGIGSGGNGDWGKYNYGFGGGGASGIEMGKDRVAMIVAGGGGGGTVEWKVASGWGGKGGCEAVNDPVCRGRDSGNNYFSQGNRDVNNGGSSPKGDEKGGGGGGVRGGQAGYLPQVGGHGGTSGIANRPDIFTLKSKAITPGVNGHSSEYGGYGYVKLTVVPSSY